MTQELAPKVESLHTSMLSLQIINLETLDQANTYREANKALIAEIKASFDDLVKAAKVSYEKVRDERARLLDPLLMADTTIKNRMADWQVAENRKIQEAQAREREIARKKAEDEQLRRAQQAQEAGNAKQAAAILEQPTKVVFSAPPAEKVKSKVSVREEATFELVNEQEIPREYLMVDEVKIRKVVRALGLEAKIPGIRIFTRTIAVGR